jgi:hypothetical protein
MSSFYIKSEVSKEETQQMRQHIYLPLINKSTGKMSGNHAEEKLSSKKKNKGAEFI